MTGAAAVEVEREGRVVVEQVVTAEAAVEAEDINLNKMRTRGDKN